MKPAAGRGRSRRLGSGRRGRSRRAGDPRGPAADLHRRARSSRPSPDRLACGDDGNIELFTWHALHDVQLGSIRTHGNLAEHLGPMYFYLLAPLYGLFGCKFVGLQLGAIADQSARNRRRAGRRTPLRRPDGDALGGTAGGLLRPLHERSLADRAFGFPGS